MVVIFFCFIDVLVLVLQEGPPQQCRLLFRTPYPHSRRLFHCRGIPSLESTFNFMCLKSGIGSSSRHFQSGKRFFFSCSVSIILALQPRGRFSFFLAGMGTGKCAPAETSIWSLHRISSFPRSKSIRGVPSCSKALGCFSFPAQNGHWELSQKVDPDCCICIV